MFNTRLPTASGLVIRPYREADADALYDLRLACARADQVDPQSTSERLPSLTELRADWAEPAAAPEPPRALLAERDGRLAAATRVDAWRERDGCWVYLISGWVLPELRRQGLGTALLAWGEQTAAALAARDHPGELFEFAANVSSTQPDAIALLSNNGYTAGYTVIEMGRPLSNPPPIASLASGFKVRPAQPAHLEAIAACVLAAYEKEFAGNRYFQTWTLRDELNELQEPEQDPALWQVAWSGDEVAGVVLGRIEKGCGVIFEVGVRPEWRRQGLARALLTRTLLALQSRGLEYARLHTVAEFPTRACDLYASVGFTVLKEFPRYRKVPMG